MASKGVKFHIVTDDPQELESVNPNVIGDEVIPSSSQQLNVIKRLLGKMGAVLAVVGLVGAVVMIMPGYHTPQQPTSSAGFVELDEAPTKKVGAPEGGDVSPDMSSSLNPPKLCDAAVVKSVCGELKSDTTQPACDQLGVMEIAEALGLDEVPAMTVLGSLGLVGLHAHVTVKCQDLCESIVASIPEDRRPPGHDVGGRLAFDKIVWDIDLSPEALAAIHIPDDPADPKGSKGDPDQKDLPLQRRLHYDSGEKATSTIAGDAATILANLFRIYPAAAAPGAPPAALPAAAPPAALPAAAPPAALPAATAVNPCAPATAAPIASPCAPATVTRRLASQGNEEAIYGNGKKYIGHQTQTRTGKTCLPWSRFRGYTGDQNYCRNNDGSETIWCFTSEAWAWGLCDPIGAPPGYAEAVEKARIVAKAWLTKTLREFSGEKLPGSYEKWLGPTQTVAKKGITKKGCACRQRWSYNGVQVKNYCGNPDQDPGGEWCLVSSTGSSCQGASWGYCFPTAETSKPCGPACQGVHTKLVATAALLDQLTFKYDADDVGAYAYIMTWGNTVKERIAVKDIQSIQSGYKANGKVSFQTTAGSDETAGRKVIYMCPTWWNLCKSKLQTCGRDDYGTTIGTLIHETMHHVPIAFKDYLYYRGVTSKWTAANKGNHLATKVVKNAADPMEYFVADNNGYKNTGR